MTGYLILENGLVEEGLWHEQPPGSKPFPFSGGEVVFNTSHSGYEEIATDPSYCEQIIIMTAPHQGNYALTPRRRQSSQFWIKGFVCGHLQNSVNNSTWKNELLQNGVPILSDIDTRRVTISLRKKGVSWGIIISEDNIQKRLEKLTAKYHDRKTSSINSSEFHENNFDNSLKDIFLNLRSSSTDEYVRRVSCHTPYEVQGEHSSGYKVSILDMGVKDNIISNLKKKASLINVYPYNTKADVLIKNSDIVLVSNGPGDPSHQKEAIETVKKLIGRKPVFGICMGCQILALAVGAQTYKMKFGHRGSNHPIKDFLLNKIYMSSQNHGYAIDRVTLPNWLKASHINLNDHTVAGVFSKEKNILGVQFHPEHCPGPEEAGTLFDYCFQNLLK